MKMMVAITAVVGVLALAPAAFAQSTGTGYAGQGGVAGQVQQGGEGGVAGQTASGSNANGSAATNASGGGGVLAFTGLDLLLIAGGGLVLLVGGVALSRLVARHPA
ncbi:MAG: hypothetical protein ACJ75Z_04305 [Solirubrobacterales bacterium]